MAGPSTTVNLAFEQSTGIVYAQGAGNANTPVNLAASLLIEDASSTVQGLASTLVLPTGTLSIVGGVATFTPAVGGPIADKAILANISGASAVPVGATLSAILDDILGSTQGNLITRNAGGWTVLGPSTGGKVLTENGPAANLSWNTATGGGVTLGQVQALVSIPTFVG